MRRQNLLQQGRPGPGQSDYEDRIRSSNTAVATSKQRPSANLDLHARVELNQPGLIATLSALESITPGIEGKRLLVAPRILERLPQCKTQMMAVNRGGRAVSYRCQHRRQLGLL